MSMINRRKALLLPFALAFALSACEIVQGRETTGQYVDDTAITTKVKAQLLDDPTVKSTQVSVETMKGVVQLSGFVENKQIAVRAEQITRNVQGVRGVKNDLVVR
jgi:hyperosmotically inducible periplasmic protein